MSESETERLWLNMSKEKADQLREQAKGLNLSLSQYMGMCVWLGAKQVQKGLNNDSCLCDDKRFVP